MPVFSLLSTKDHSLAQGEKVISCPYTAMRDLVAAVDWQEYIMGCTKLHCAAQGTWAAGQACEKEELLADLSNYLCDFFFSHFSQHNFICTEIASCCNKITPPNTWKGLIWCFELGSLSVCTKKPISSLPVSLIVLWLIAVLRSYACWLWAESYTTAPFLG